MSAKSYRRVAILLPVSALLHAACGTTYTATTGATGDRVLADGAIVLSDGAVVMPGDGSTVTTGSDGSATAEDKPFVAFGPSGSCFVGASGVPRCEGAVHTTYSRPDVDQFGAPIDVPTTYTLELKSLNFPAKVQKVWITHSGICVLAGESGGGLYCAGNNDSLQLGAGTTDAETPFLPLHAIAGFESGISDAMIGGDYGCALKAGQISCWGTGVTTGPVALPAPAVQLAGGVQSRCAMTGAGDVYCWGYSVVPRAQSSDTYSSSAVPVLANTQGKVRSLSMSPLGQHACAVGANGVVLCWGRNSTAQVGQAATNTLVDVPTPVSAVSPGALVAGAGAEHSCAIKDNGAVFCWGNADRGALGDNLTRSGVQYVAAPVAVDQLSSGASALYVGYGSACALVGSEANRSFKCWGDNTLGKLQNGNTNDQKAPVIVALPN